VAFPADAPRLVQLFCDRRVPPSDDLRLEVETRANEITILERRPFWRPDADAEWSSLPVAKLHWDPQAQLWSLRCSDSSGRWHRYDEAPPSADLGSQLVEIDRDPTGIFWG
jgi:Protein of unknown function (DUF3024)